MEAAATEATMACAFSVEATTTTSAIDGKNKETKMDGDKT
jgi:hypothetical protein